MSFHPEQYNGRTGYRSTTPLKFSPEKSVEDQKKEAINTAIERRETSIRTYTEKKTEQINITSSFNAAAAFCTALMNNKLLDPKDYWTKHKEIYDDYLSRLVEAQNGARNGIQEMTYERIAGK